MHTKEEQQAFKKCKMTTHVKKESYKFKAPSQYIGKSLTCVIMLF
jgi:hypothetical protein